VTQFICKPILEAHIFSEMSTCFLASRKGVLVREKSLCWLGTDVHADKDASKERHLRICVAVIAVDLAKNGMLGLGLALLWLGFEFVLRGWRLPGIPGCVMVYIASWQDFQRAAEDLYAKSPNKVSCLPCFCPKFDPSFTRTRSPQTRYCVKWKSSEGKLVLKITDDTTVSTRPNRTCQSMR
jgi:hypothetical protein